MAYLGQALHNIQAESGLSGWSEPVSSLAQQNSAPGALLSNLIMELWGLLLSPAAYSTQISNDFSKWYTNTHNPTHGKMAQGLTT